MGPRIIISIRSGGQFVTSQTGIVLIHGLILGGYSITRLLLVTFWVLGITEGGFGKELAVIEFPVKRGKRVLISLSFGANPGGNPAFTGSPRVKVLSLQYLIVWAFFPVDPHNLQVYLDKIGHVTSPRAF